MRGTSEAAQAKRRKKVMDVAVRLAVSGGLEAVQIRDVVARTGVSSATIYRYFSSKEHLLVAALAEERFAMSRISDARPEEATAAQRVISLLRTPTEALTSVPRLAAAMLQAMTSGEPGVTPILAAMTEPLVEETAHAIRPGNPTPADYELARTVQRVWFAAVVGWVTAAETADSISHAVETAAHQLLEPTHEPVQ